MHRPFHPRRTRRGSLDLIIAILWVVVLTGVAGLLLGWFDREHEITEARVSPGGAWLILRSEVGAVSTHAIAQSGGGKVGHAAAATMDLRDVEFLSWGDPETLVGRRGDDVLIVTVRDLVARPWFTTPSSVIVLGRTDRTLIAIANPEDPEAPLPTLRLSNFEVGERPAPGEDARGLPFEEPLVNIQQLPPSVEVELAEGRLTLTHPQLPGGPTVLGLPRPSIVPAAAVFILAAVLVTLRRVRAWQKRRERLRQAYEAEPAPQAQA